MSLSASVYIFHPNVFHIFGDIVSIVMSSTYITAEEITSSLIFLFLHELSTSAVLKVSHSFPVGILQLAVYNCSNLLNFAISLLAPQNRRLHSTSSLP